MTTPASKSRTETSAAAASKSSDWAQSYQEFIDTELRGAMAMERMLAGLSSRRCGVGLELVGEAVEAEATSPSQSAVSLKFVATLRPPARRLHHETTTHNHQLKGIST